MADEKQKYTVSIPGSGLPEVEIEAADEEAAAVAYRLKFKVSAHAPDPTVKPAVDE